MTRKREPEHQAEAGFAITVYDQRHIEDAAMEKFGPRWGEKEDRDQAMKDGLITADGQITQAGWDLLADDIDKLESNSMKWLRTKFQNARDEGHDSHDDLIGTVWYDPRDPDQAWHIELAAGGDRGRHERIDMVDVSYGDLGDTAFNGVSWFGGLILGGHITFFEVTAEDMDIIQDTLEQARKKEKRQPARALHEAANLPHLVTGALSPQAKLVHSGQERGIRFEVYHDPHAPRGAKGHPGNPYSAVVFTPPYGWKPGDQGDVEAEQIGRGHTEAEAIRIAGGYIARLTAPPRPRGRRN